MADWSLQAVITTNEDEHHHHHHHQHHQDHVHNCYGSIDIKKEYDQALLFCFPHLFDDHHDHDHDDHATTTTNELDQLYNPFYNPVFGTEIELIPPPVPAAASSTDHIPTIHHHHKHHDHDHDHHHHGHHGSEKDVQQEQGMIRSSFCGSASSSSQLAPKLKKRKNQQKRVVVQVTADGLSSDPWAWRKYGQKPIKGSIYPRSYYRCSSSKGCMARRQVEQSCTDPSIYILTYTADHNHAQPTRRNSLAGINRNRFKTPTAGSKTITGVSSSKDQSPFHSPTTPSVSSIDDEINIQQSNIKQEIMSYNNKFEIDQEHAMIGEINDDDFMIFSDNFFEGLEDLGGVKMDSSSSSSYNNCSNQQFPHVFS